MFFPVSGLEIFPLWPPLAAFGLSLFCSVAGVTGAFLLIPVQISLFGFVTPAVSATSHTFNIFAGFGGAMRYLREGRLIKPMASALLVGSLPGGIIGSVLRVTLLPDPSAFKAFAGIVLILMAAQMAGMEIKGRVSSPSHKVPDSLNIVIHSAYIGRVTYSFDGRIYSLNLISLGIISFIIGIVSGVYGVGGGLFATVYLVGFLGLPVHTTAGSTLLATMLTSLISVVGFTWLAPLVAPDAAVRPDWMLGALFGLGGVTGTYMGARLQRFLPGRVIRFLLILLMTVIAGKYLTER